MFANVKDFVDDVFEAEDIASDMLFDEFIWLDVKSFAVDFSVSLFVDKFADDFLWRLTPSDIVFDWLDHGEDLPANFDEDCCIDLS